MLRAALICGAVLCPPIQGSRPAQIPPTLWVEALEVLCPTIQLSSYPMFPIIISFFFHLPHMFPLSSFLCPTYFLYFLLITYYVTTNWEEVYLSPTPAPLLGRRLKSVAIPVDGVTPCEIRVQRSSV